VGGASIQIVHYFDHGYLEEEKSMIQSFTVNFGTTYLTGMVTSVPPNETCSLHLKGALVVGTTDNICGRSLSSKISVDMNSIILKLYVT
jgi:hypothetical protein